MKIKIISIIIFIQVTLAAVRLNLSFMTIKIDALPSQYDFGSNWTVRSSNGSYICPNGTNYGSTIPANCTNKQIYVNKSALSYINTTFNQINKIIV